MTENKNCVIEYRSSRGEFKLLDHNPIYVDINYNGNNHKCLSINVQNICDRLYSLGWPTDNIKIYEHQIKLLIDYILNIIMNYDIILLQECYDDFYQKIILDSRFQEHFKSDCQFNHKIDKKGITCTFKSAKSSYTVIIY